MSMYAALPDLYTHGAPEKAFGQLEEYQKNNAIIAASSVVDSFLRGRYSLPLLDWDIAITEATCRIAAYNLLVARGYNPAAGSDPNILDRYNQAMMWLEKVQKQQAHPNIVAQPDNSPNYDQPTVITSSVVNLGTGATSRNRGW